MLFKSFTILQFNYSPIVSIFQDRNLNNKISNILERAVSLPKIKKSSSKTLLKRDLTNLRQFI